MTINLLNESPVFLEASEEEIGDRLDPDSLYSTFLHKKKENITTVELSKLASLREETYNPRDHQKDTIMTSIELGEIDSTFGTVLPKQVDASTIKKGSRARYKTGDILFARIRPNLRRTAHVSNQFEDGLCSKEFYVLTPEQNVKPLYLLMMLRSKYCVSQAKGKVTGSSRPRTPPEKLKKMRIPLIDESVQLKIDRVVETAFSILDSSRHEINSIVSNLSANLEAILPKNLRSNTVEISPPTVGERLDPEYYSVKQWLSKLDPEKLDVTSLVDVASFSDAFIDPRERPMQIFDYIEIQNVNPRTGQIDSFSQVLGKNAAGRAKRPIKAGQILISTTRPARGSIAIVPEYHDSDVASTGFQLLETKDESLTEYLYCALRTDFCLTQIWGKSTGTGYPEISREELETVKIPVLDKLLSKNKMVEVRRLISLCQMAKVSLIELEGHIERRLEDEISDNDIASICEGMIESLTLAAQGTQPILLKTSRPVKRESNNKTLHEYSESS